MDLPPTPTRCSAEAGGGIDEGYTDEDFEDELATCPSDEPDEAASVIEDNVDKTQDDKQEEGTSVQAGAAGMDAAGTGGVVDDGEIAED